MSRVPAMQAVVAGEQAAVYAFGVIGARLQGTSDEPAARAAWDRHRTRRDQVSAMLVAAGAEVPAAAPAYDLGGPVVTAAAARRLAAAVEQACCAPYADWVAAADRTSERATPARWLSESATAAVSWGGAPIPFPGLPERT